MNIEDLRKICLRLPAVTEDVKWGADLCFSVGGKMFLVTGLDRTPVAVSLKVKDELFDEVISRKGFTPAPYLARYKWVTIEDISLLTDNELKEFIVKSYELIKSKLPKKILESLKNVS